MAARRPRRAPVRLHARLLAPPALQLRPLRRRSSDGAVLGRALRGRRRRRPRRPRPHLRAVRPADAERRSESRPSGSVSSSSGTGGFGHADFEPVLVPNSEVRDNDAFGILELTLEPDGYSWTFLPVPGGTLSDSGSGTCHDAQADTTRPSSSLTSPGVRTRWSAALQTVTAEAFDDARPRRASISSLGQTVIGTDSTRPFAFEWDTTAIRGRRSHADGPCGRRGRQLADRFAAGRDRQRASRDHDRQGAHGRGRHEAAGRLLPSEPGATFACSLNGRPFKPCSTPRLLPRPRDGPHVFAVRARDAAGNLAPKTVTWNWSVDHLAPRRRSLSRRAARVRPGRATFGFRASETATFRCSLDNGPWTPCTSTRALPEAPARPPHVPRPRGRPGGKHRPDARDLHLARPARLALSRGKRVLHGFCDAGEGSGNVSLARTSDAISVRDGSRESFVGPA